MGMERSAKIIRRYQRAIRAAGAQFGDQTASSWLSVLRRMNHRDRGVQIRNLRDTAAAFGERR